MWQGLQKGANFCTTLLLFYHTSDCLKVAKTVSRTFQDVDFDGS